MKDIGMSSRALAVKLSSATRKITHTTIWAWTKNTDGYPPKETYTSEINRRLALALDIKPEILAAAFEESRRHLIVADHSASSRGPLSVLRMLFADSRQSTWEREDIVKLIDDVQGL